MRKRSGVPSGELSDTRRLGSADARWYASQGEKAVFRRRSMAARNAVKTPGETARGAGARPRCAAPRRTRPEVPSAVTVGAASGAEPSKTSRVAQDCDPKAYMYMSSGRKDALIGRLSRASTVAPTVTAHWKANQHRQATAHQHPTRSQNTQTDLPWFSNRRQTRFYGTICVLSGIELRGDGGMNGSHESRGLKLT